VFRTRVEMNTALILGAKTRRVVATQWMAEAEVLLSYNRAGVLQVEGCCIGCQSSQLSNHCQFFLGSLEILPVVSLHASI